MIIPKKEIVELCIFRCPMCDGLYRRNPKMENVSCCVLHPPGSCCHYSDIPVSEESLGEISAALD